MKLWLATTDDYHHDAYDAFVVRAKNETEAREIINNKAIPYIHQKWVVEPLYVKGDSGIVCSSFNAG
jgi:hypothetical protein